MNIIMTLEADSPAPLSLLLGSVTCPVLIDAACLASFDYVPHVGFFSLSVSMGLPFLWFLPIERRDFYLSAPVYLAMETAVVWFSDLIMVGWFYGRYL